MRYLIQALAIFLLVFQASCSPETSTEGGSLAEWVYTDLRALDPPDRAEPAQDIIAAYIRYHPERRLFQIRLDFLDLATRSELDLYIALDHAPGGSDSLPINADLDIAWDTLLIIPQSGAIQVIDSFGELRTDSSVRVIRDTILDTISIEIDANPIIKGSPLGFQAQVFTTPTDSLDVADRTEPFHSSDDPPGPAQLLLGFWNTFPAYTPAQSLRRWDGAHTGPYGGRHGLYNLLRISKSRDIPIALLDLKYPPSISALDYGAGLNMVADLAAQGLLILPEIMPYPNPAGSPHTISASSPVRDSGPVFNLPTSPFLYSPLGDTTAKDYPVIFTSAPDLQEQIVSIFRQGQRVVIPIPAQPPEQATPGGPTLNVRRALIETAIQANNLSRGVSNPLLVLGGNLPKSTWGDPVSARATMNYIAQHPWIQPLNAYDLLSARTTPANRSHGPIQPTAGISTLPPPPRDLPDSPISAAAWDAYLSLYAPLTNMLPELADLRSNYAWLVDALHAAAEWDTDPKPIASCEVDPDGDGTTKCILASEEVYALFEPDDGSLVFVFVRTGSTRNNSGRIISGTHQLIGPSSQFIVGASDPSTWDLARGSRADPAVISGAFADDLGPYQAEVSENQIVFQGPNAVKLYQLTENGLHMEFQGSQPTQFQVPLVVDPWLRFNPGWGECFNGNFVGDKITGDYLWGFIPNERCACRNDGVGESTACPPVKILVESSAGIIPFQFVGTRDLMGGQENPNTEFPPGHYLPFPISLIQVSGTKNFNFDISVQP